MRVAYALIIASSACGRFGDYDVNVRSSAIVDNGDTMTADDVLWDELDGSVSGNGIANHPADATCAHIIASSSGAIYVLWADAGTGAYQAYLRAFTDSWGSLAGSADGGGMSQGSGQVTDGTHLTCPGALALDSSDNVYAAWHNWDGVQQSIDVRVWHGGAWSGLGGSDVGNGINPGGAGWWPSIVIDGNGRAVVAYEQASNPYVVRWENPWTGVGGAGSGTGLAASDGNSFIPTLAAGQGTDLFAVWNEYTASADDHLIHAAHWSQAAGWVSLGDVIGHTTTVTQPPGILTYGGAPLVYWADGEELTAQLHMILWSGTSWQAMAPPVTNATGFSVHVDKNGHLLAAWTQSDGTHRQIHASWFDGSAWQSLDPSEGSVSHAPVDADAPDIAVDGNNRVTIIWRQQNDSGVQVLYGRRTSAPVN